jgi:inner membrane protein
MTRTGHHLTGLAAGILAAGLFHGTAPSLAWLIVPCAWFGGVAPDRLEYLGPWRWVRHRTVTHWWLLWVALLGYAVYLGGFAGALLFGFGLGGLTHLLFDLPNPMGVPALHPWHRVSLRWWRSGEHEWLLVPMAFGAAALPWVLAKQSALPGALALHHWLAGILP